MAKRHVHRPGDWESVAVRLDEIISAHSGEDPFEEALTLLVARLAHEVTAPRGRFVGTAARARAEVDRLVAVAAARWPGIVEPGRVTRLSGPELVRCAAVLDGVALLADELVGLDAIFEFIVGKVAKGQKGQYFTPRHVIGAVVDMVAPAAGERVVDPACGSGGFLGQAARRSPGCVTWGFDHDPRAARVARVMVAASGQAPARVIRADSLRRPLLEDHLRAADPRARGFDVVLTNPPFAGDVGDEYPGYELGAGRRVERDVLFIERCVELLRPGGRFAIVLPHNKVGGEAWAHVRAWLLARARVVAVVGLGRNTFLPHTSQKACVVLGQRRTRPARALEREEILFFISERDGKDPRGRLRRDPTGAVDHDLAEAATLIGPRMAALATRGEAA